MNAYDPQSADFLHKRLKDLKNRIGVLEIENNRLKTEVVRLSKQVDDYWETVEDVATGMALECVKCGKPRPCLCQDT